MITVKHIVTKKLEKGWERLVFEIENTSDNFCCGEFFFELKWLWGAVYNVRVEHLRMPKQFKKRFTIDLESDMIERFSKFKFMYYTRNGLIEGKGKKSRNRENLTDVVKKEKIETYKNIGCCRWY